MIKDSQFIMTFQLALIGIVLVGGLFLIWKSQARLEDKIDSLLTDRRPPPVANIPGGFDPIDTTVADEMMKHLFGGGNAEMVFGTCPMEPEKPSVQVEEVEPAPSESTEPLSKSKLRNMTLDKLKKICEEKNLSPEGTKNQLIDRILE